jgi:hypothetical protein
MASLFQQEHSVIIVWIDASAIDNEVLNPLLGALVEIAEIPEGQLDSP